MIDGADDGTLPDQDVETAYSTKFYDDRGMLNTRLGLSLAVGDTNGDGVLELVVGTDAAYTLAVTWAFELDGPGVFGVSEASAKLSAAAESEAVAVGDINGDGADEVGVGVPNLQGMVYMLYGWSL